MPSTTSSGGAAACAAQKIVTRQPRSTRPAAIFSRYRSAPPPSGLWVSRQLRKTMWRPRRSSRSCIRHTLAARGGPEARDCSGRVRACRARPSPYRSARKDRWRATLGRSVRLLREFRYEQPDPARFYSAIAEDSVGQLSSYGDLDGQVLLDVGGGPGYFRNAFRAAGATYYALDADVGELAGLGRDRRGHGHRQRHGPAVRGRLASTSATPPTSSSTSATRGGWPTRCSG